MTLTFGFIHGFGFAGVLLEIALSQGEMALALLSFNLGLELGQLLFVAAVMLMSAFLTRKIANLRALITPWLTGILYGLGCYWFLGRGLVA